MVQAVLKYEKSKKNSIITVSRKLKHRYDVQPTVEEDQLKPTAAAKTLKEREKKAGLHALKETWRNKSLHGKYPQRLEKSDVDSKSTHRWLQRSGLKAGIYYLLITVRDQSFPTNVYRSKVVNDGTDPLCRICKKSNESVDHLIAGCPILASKEYKARHECLGEYIHWNVCKYYNINVLEKWYEHHPVDVTNGKDVTILWDFTIHTDSTTTANKPDIVIKDVKARTCQIIDMAVPCDSNISTKEYDKLQRYKDLEIEITRMWHLKATTITIIMGALGMIRKRTGKNIEKISGNRKFQELQKITLIVTAHILRKTSI